MPVGPQHAYSPQSPSFPMDKYEDLNHNVSEREDSSNSILQSVREQVRIPRSSSNLLTQGNYDHEIINHFVFICLHTNTF
jgi:hypothetical protein